MHLRPRSTATRLGCAAAVLLLVPACSDHGSPSGSPSPAHGSTATQAAGSGQVARVELESRVTRVAGHLSDVRREQVARHVRATVEDYLRGAFADGGHPFRPFVPGLRRAAKHDAGVLEAAHHGGVTHARAWVSVAAIHGHAVGATARLAVKGPTEKLTGRLVLTKEGSRWRVFGYDLARGER